MKIAQTPTACDHFNSFNFQYVTVNEQQAYILEKMQYGRDYTIGELSWLTKIDKSTIAPRRLELLDKKQIVRSKKRKCMFSEVTCQTVMLKPKQGE